MYKCTANPLILQYTVVDTLRLVGTEIPEMNLKKKIKLIFLSFEQRTIFESGSDLLVQRVAGSREPALASELEGPGLRMGHFSSGAPPSPSLAF